MICFKVLLNLSTELINNLVIIYLNFFIFPFKSNYQGLKYFVLMY